VVEIQQDGAISVDGDGRGFPIHEVEGLSFLERALTRFHRSPTLDGHTPHEHVGLHGVGLFPVNALSSRLSVESFSGGRRYEQHFERGTAVTPLIDVASANRTGTRVTFAPDPEVFANPSVDPGPIVRRLRELSSLLPGLRLEFEDRRRHCFQEPNGLLGFLEPMREGSSDAFLVATSIGEIRVDAALRWHPYPWSTVESFANVERTTGGGTHVRGMLTGLARGLRLADRAACRGKNAKHLIRVISEGLNAVVCVRLNHPTYEGPARDRLCTPAAETAVRDSVSEAFANLLRDDPQLLSRFISRLEAAG
jgi:DNA gyrase subunit B